MKEGSTFNFKGENFIVNADMSCTVKNVKYVIECRGCGNYYIGETNNLRKRTTLHNQHIRHENLRMIPGQIATYLDKDPKYFMFPIYKMNCDSILARIEKKNILSTNSNQNSIRYKRHRVETPNKNVLQPSVYTTLLKRHNLIQDVMSDY